MKKATKICLIAAACLVLIGGAAFCIAMTANHWDFSLLSNDKLETTTFDITDDFRNISVKSDTEDIEFRLSDDGTCTVVCRERESETHTASVQNGTLLVERIDTENWFGHISLFSFESPTITVYLPQTDYEALFIEEDTGDITVPKSFQFGSVDIELSTGEVDFRASSPGLIRIQSSTGDIRAEGLSAGELDLTASTGHVDVLSVTCAGDVGVSVSTGKTNLTNVSCGSISSAGSTGDITLKNVTAEGLISIERSTGDVSFEQCDAGELTVETDTGEVTGTLLSDKVFITHSETGSIDVPETTTGGKCRITTETGDIEIRIAA